MNVGKSLRCSTGLDVNQRQYVGDSKNERFCVHKFLTVSCLIVLLIAVLGPAAFAQSVNEPPSPPHKLVVAVLDAPPFSMKNESGEWTGFSVDLWRRVARELGLDYELRETDLVGVLKGLEDKTIDASATGIYVTSSREAKIDFSDPFFVSNVTIAVSTDRLPSLGVVFRNALLSWSFIGILLLIVALALFGATLLWLLEQKGTSEHYVGKSRNSFARSLVWSVFVLSGQESREAIGWQAHPPATLAGRLFGAAWMVFGVMTISLFTASAASILTSLQLQSIINSPRDLKHVRVGTVVGSTDHNLLKEQHLQPTVYNSPLELVQALADHKIDAAVYGEPILRYYQKKQFSDKIMVLRFALSKYFVAIPLPAGSNLREPINNLLLKTVEDKEWHTTLAEYMGNED